MPCTFKASPDGADSGRVSAGSRRDFFHLRRRQPCNTCHLVLAKPIFSVLLASFQHLFSVFFSVFLAFSQSFLLCFFVQLPFFIIFLASSVHLLNDKGLASMICFILEIFHKESEIYIQSAPNNSNESYSFMCLGRVGHFGQC